MPWKAALNLLGGTVAADETFIGGKRRGVGSGYVENKTPVISTVERGGKVRSKPVGRVTGREITQVLRDHVAQDAHLNTDESPVYEIDWSGVRFPLDRQSQG